MPEAYESPSAMYTFGSARAARCLEVSDCVGAAEAWCKVEKASAARLALF
jgi:hypothetical protein